MTKLGSCFEDNLSIQVCDSYSFLKKKMYLDLYFGMCFEVYILASYTFYISRHIKSSKLKMKKKSRIKPLFLQTAIGIKYKDGVVVGYGNKRKLF